MFDSFYVVVRENFRKLVLENILNRSAEIWGRKILSYQVALQALTYGRGKINRRHTCYKISDLLPLCWKINNLKCKVPENTALNPALHFRRAKWKFNREFITLFCLGYDVFSGARKLNVFKRKISYFPIIFDISNPDFRNVNFRQCS